MYASSCVELTISLLLTCYPNCTRVAAESHNMSSRLYLQASVLSKLRCANVDI